MRVQVDKTFNIGRVSEATNRSKDEMQLPRGLEQGSGRWVCAKSKRHRKSGLPGWWNDGDSALDLYIHNKGKARLLFMIL